jgi:stage II sporulation protein D
MKKRNNSRWLIIGIFVIVVVSVFFTFLILYHMKPKQTGSVPWVLDSEDPNGKLLLENVYITDCSGGIIYFLYEGQECSLEGELEESYTGIADIRIKNQKVCEIGVKKEYVEGTLLGYLDQEIKIEGYGWVECAPNYGLYSDYGQEICGISLSDLVVGSSELKYYVADGKICAVVQSVETTATEIRVLIKNGGKTAYSSLFFSCEQNWYIDDVQQNAGEIFDAVSYMRQQNLEEIHLTWEGASMYLCDSQGNPTSENYEGSFSVLLYDREAGIDAGIVLVNTVPLETYVCYVLPSEMPETFSYEALKAQAVCARTYACSQMKDGRYAAYGANLDDTTTFQVYNNIGRKELCDQAVTDTKGQILTYEGELINCYYYSTSPGVTENLEVWQKDSPAYLAVLNFTEKEYTDLSKEETFLRYMKDAPDSYDSGSSFYRWSAVLDISGGTDAVYGALKKISVSSRTKAGYVCGLTVSYEYGSVLLENENEIRQFLGKYLTELTLSDGSTRTGFTSLPSACFAITETDGSTLYLTGGGFGHGIGMSQYGADAMGKAGLDYRAILEAYYPGAEISQLEP